MKVWALHLATLAIVALLLVTLPPSHATNLARILVLAVFAIGYNLASAIRASSPSATRCFSPPGSMARPFPSPIWACPSFPP